MSDFVWPSDIDRAENDELNRVCEHAEQLEDDKARLLKSLSEADDEIERLRGDGPVSQPEPSSGVPEEIIKRCEEAIEYASEIRGGCISGVREGQKRVRAILTAAPTPEAGKDTVTRDEILVHAHMAGQADAGVDPSYSSAKAYAHSSPEAGQTDKAPVAEVVSGYSGDPDTLGDKALKEIDLSNCKIGTKLYARPRPQPPQEGE